MPYTAPTLAQAQADLASRLNDPANVRWVADELTGYLREALRVWSVWTQHWRNRGSFTTTLAQPFYDLSVELPTLRAQSATNWDLVTDLQYSLLEPAAAGGTWTGTDQFNLSQLTAAIQRRRDQFLRETGCVLTRTETTITPPASGRVPLDEAFLIIRRAGWRVSATGILYPLLVTDEWAGTNYQPTWVISTMPPSWYSVSVTPPLSLQIMPPPVGDGILDLVSVNKGTPVTSGAALSLGIPDDYLWVIKYGVLADLLSGDGLALDNQRAAYCEARWQQAIDQCRRASVVLAASISNADSPSVQIPCATGSLSDADRYSPTWELVPGVPKKVLLSGQNLVALWPPPGATGGQWTVELDVVQNAPVPVVAGDVLQLSADVYDSILDLAQHAALFKDGPGQVEQSMALYDRAARAAGVENKIAQALSPARVPMLGQQSQDRRAVAEQRSVPTAAAVVEVD